MERGLAFQAIQALGPNLSHRLAIPGQSGKRRHSAALQLPPFLPADTSHIGKRVMTPPLLGAHVEELTEVAVFTGFGNRCLCADVHVKDVGYQRWIRSRGGTRHRVQGVGIEAELEDVPGFRLGPG